MSETHYTDEQIARLLDGITPGEWKITRAIPEFGYDIGPDVGYEIDGDRGLMIGRREDAEFIAAAPAIIEQQRDEIARLKEAS
jgi:hypothetical protein